MLTAYNIVVYGFYQFAELFVWWYTKGLFLVSRRLVRLEQAEFVRIGAWTWLKNLFVPMFHDYTVVGRLLSFVFRVGIIIGKLVRTLLGFIVRVILFTVWVALPVVWVYWVYVLISNIQFAI